VNAAFLLTNRLSRLELRARVRRSPETSRFAEVRLRARAARAGLAEGREG
jgi:hypothetical protein